MTAPGEGDAAMSFDTQSAVNNQGLKDLSIKSAFPDGVQNLQANDVAHLKNQVPGINGSDSPVDVNSKPPVADINLPTPTDSAVDSSGINGASAAATMETEQPTDQMIVPSVEDPAVQQPVSESREPVEPISQEQAAEIQAHKVSSDPTEPAASVAQGDVPASAVVPEQAEPPAPAAADTNHADAMDITQDTTEPSRISAPAVDLPHHPPVSGSNGEIDEKPTTPARTPALDTPQQVKTEVASADAPLESTVQDTDMKDVPPSPGKVSRSREDDSGVEEPEAKRMRPSSAAGSAIAAAAASPADAGSPSSPAPGTGGERDFQSPITEPQQKAIAIVIANTKRSTHSTMFSKPVDAVALNIPTYPEIIKEPMDLGTMNEKVKNRQYPNVRTFVDDFGLIVANCERFNGKGHAVTANAYKLQETFEKQMKRVPSADFVEPPPPEKKKKIAAPRAPARRESRTLAQPKTPVAASPTQTYALNPDGIPLIRRDSAAVDGRPRREIHPPASKDLPYSARPKKKKFQVELRFCSSVLHELDKAKYTAFANPFKQPVDPVALNIPNYHKVIKKPMDLSTMRKKLDNGMYENAKDFDNDMRLMFTNCYKFNQPGDFVHQAGKQLEAEYDIEWAKKDEYIRANAPDSGAHSAGSTPDIETEDEEEEEEEEEEEDVDQIAKLQSQIAAMSQQLNTLTKKKKKSPPVAPKKKGGKKESKKADKKAEKKSSKKSKGGATPYVSYEQKQDISNRINTLPETRMMQALDIIKNNMPNLKGVNEDELELDIDELSNDVLYKLLQFVKKYAPKPEDEQANENSRRQSYAPTQPSKPKKNKPMGAREQESRIEQLRRMQSDNGLDGAMAAESSDDDEDSDDESEEE